jgi:L-alanine-DL-glutamate epimerase-like enolase superfamily enzyme
LSAVRIVGVDIFGYGLRYAHGAYAMSGGRAISTLPATVVRVRTDEGLVGFGEACPLGGTYLESFSAGVRAAMSELATALLGCDPRELGQVNRRMDAALRGQRAAKSALDIACWDLLGRATGLSITTLLGGRLTRDFPLYVAVPLDAPEAMVEHVRARRAEGIRRFQLKLGGDPGHDGARVRAVHEAAGEDALLIADANGGWRRHDALVAVRLLEGLERVLLEQPCPTLDECLAVRRRTTLPLVLDEVIVDAETLASAAFRDGMDAVNVKLGRLGGLTAARLATQLAEQLGLRVTVEDTWGGDIVTAAVSHLAASTRPEALLTVSFMNDWTLDHVAGYAPRSAAGVGNAPEGPGLAIEVDSEQLGEPLATIGRPAR